MYPCSFTGQILKLDFRAQQIYYALGRMGNEQANSDVKTPIVVTGATGFVGQNIIKMLLEKQYFVKGTVRHLSIKDKYQHLYNFPGSERLSITEADITDPDCWDSVFEGYDYVIHAAIPDSPFTTQDEEALTKPAVEGVTNVMKAAIRQKVKRVIYTSSAITLSQHSKQDLVLNETFWGAIEGNFPYPKSKILAEKKIWEIYNCQNLTEPHTQLVTLLPSTIVGPLYSSHTNPSQELLSAIMNGQFKGIPTPEVVLNVVDVRDVAEAHCLALVKPNIDGHRIIISADSITYTNMFSWLKSEFPNSPIPEEPASINKISEKGPQTLHRTLSALPRYQKMTNFKSEDLLGIKYRSPKESVITMAYDLIKLGVVKYQ